MSDCFLKFDKIDGEVSDGDASLVGAIRLVAWNWGAFQYAGDGRAKAKGSAGEIKQFSFSYVLDAAAVNFMQHCVVNKVVPKALLTMRRAGGKAQTYLTIAFTEVRFVSVDFVHDPTNDIPLVRVTFSFLTVEARYSEQSATGANKTGAQTFSHKLDAVS